MDTTLNACLEALDTGESMDSILLRYPAVATELRPFLETAVSLTTQATNPTIAAKTASLAAMKKEAATLRPRKHSGFALFFHRARRFAPAMALVAVLLLSLMTAVAPPNSPLYGARQVLDGWRNDQQGNDGVIEVEVVETAVSPIISPTLTPTLTTTPSPTLTVSVTPTMTTTETTTVTPTVTSTATIAPSATPSPPTLTATPLPAPTATDSDDQPDEPDDSELEGD